MSASQFGQLFKISTFGESHGPALGVVIDGCPAGVEWNETLMHEWLERRRPGQNSLVSARQELDQVDVLSGVFEGRTLGTPIAAVVYNRDTRSQDYSAEVLRQRQGHATDLWQSKFGHSDPRGSGRASGRETLSRVIGGCVAQMLSLHICREIVVKAQPLNIGPIEWNETQETQSAIRQLLEKARETGESYGGTVGLRIKALPKGLGQPVFHKFKSDLAGALLSIGATTGLEIGEGFSSSEMRGTEFHKSAQNYGGLRGGITTGEVIEAKIVFKPTSSIMDIAKKGRHDPCIVLRAIPVVEAMTWLVIADHLLWSRLDRATLSFS